MNAFRTNIKNDDYSYVQNWFHHLFGYDNDLHFNYHIN